MRLPVRPNTALFAKFAKSVGAAPFLLMLVVGGSPIVSGCNKKQAEPSAAPEPPPAAAPAPVPPAPPKVKVTKVELGNALNADKHVKSASASFGTKDTIFASVVTEGATAPTELTARWTFQDGQLVNETKRTIAPTPMAVTEFSIQKPKGWPPGDYKVEISVDGKPVETKAFKVQ